MSKDLYIYLWLLLVWDLVVQQIIIIIITRSYAALWVVDLEWIVGPGYSLGGYILEIAFKWFSFFSSSPAQAHLELELELFEVDDIGDDDDDDSLHHLVTN